MMTAARGQGTGRFLQELNSGHAIGAHVKELFYPMGPYFRGYRSLDRRGDLTLDPRARFPREVANDPRCWQDEAPLIQNYSDLRQKVIRIDTSADLVADGLQDAWGIGLHFESNEAQHIQRELLMSIENPRRIRVESA
jgi:hypothetical protein